MGYTIQYIRFVSFIEFIRSAFSFLVAHVSEVIDSRHRPAHGVWEAASDT